jgi:nucleotide-binding universal stress UspA family protein
MARAILVGYDPETHDHAPIHFGIAMAAVTRTRLIIASVEAHDDRAMDCAATLRELEAELQTLDTDWECIRPRGRSAAGALDQAARERDAGLLVVGSTRRGPAGRLLPGSTAERLLHGAPCPLAVTPREWTRGDDVETIGVAYLDTEDGHEALRGAHALAGRAGARLRVITIVQVTPTMYLETEAQTSSAPRPSRTSSANTSCWRSGRPSRPCRRWATTSRSRSTASSATRRRCSSTSRPTWTHS